MVQKGGKILDAGCGIGTDAVFMQQKGYQVKGIDLSTEMIKKAKNDFPGIDFQVMDLRHPDFEEEYFHGIVASFSLIHLPKREIEITLLNFWKLLNRNGKLFLALQSGKSEEFFIDEPYKPGEKTFLNIFSVNEIKTYLEKSGFKFLQSKSRKPNTPKEFNFTKLFIWAEKI
jgi:ubiquinone/menaquinone biosynthesis C-methylase UbiE